MNFTIDIRKVKALSDAEVRLKLPVKKEVKGSKVNLDSVARSKCVMHLQLCQMNVVPLLSKPYVNEVTLREQSCRLSNFEKDLIPDAIELG